jgi:hypothetical protein
MKINKNAYYLRQLKKEWKQTFLSYEKWIDDPKEPFPEFEQWLKQENLIEDE